MLKNFILPKCEKWDLTFEQSTIKTEATTAAKQISRFSFANKT